MVTHIPNEQQLKRVLAGTEVERGVAVPPTFKLYGDFKVNKNAPLTEKNEYAGTYDPWHTPSRGLVTVDGSYAQNLTYEDAAILARYGIKGSVPATSDGNAVPGYLRRYEPSPALDDIASLAVEHGFPGMPWLSTLVMFNEFTISADVDDAEAEWKFSSNLFARSKEPIPNAEVGTATGGSATTLTKTAAGFTVNEFAGAYLKLTGGTGVGQVRQVVGNTADTITVSTPFAPAPANGTAFAVLGMFTAGIPDRTREAIRAPGTQLFLDPAGGVVGATPVESGKFISFSLTWRNNFSAKRFMEDEETSSKRVGRGMRQVTGQIRFEFDDLDEYESWKNTKVQLIRIQRLGSVIDAAAGSRKHIRIDIPAGYWDTMSEDTRENNVTVTWGFKAFVSPTSGIPAALESKTRLATLP